jgi:hypothetical protein
MCKSRFALSPGGDAPWSMRFYEALVCGAIPVVVSIREAARTEMERELNYKAMPTDDDFLYRQEWADHNFSIALKWHSFVVNHPSSQEHDGVKTKLLEAFTSHSSAWTRTTTSPCLVPASVCWRTIAYCSLVPWRRANGSPTSSLFFVNTYPARTTISTWGRLSAQQFSTAPSWLGIVTRSSQTL